ncbi:hypothetical protein [Aliikangiella maris]|uniref:Uncharacterized protein n=2 Tax=Aliikangiella maris TaxID=3162458 RepID=A0ABV2BR20_9GAMM
MKKYLLLPIFLVLGVIFLTGGCSDSSYVSGNNNIVTNEIGLPEVAIEDRVKNKEFQLLNEEAPVPPMCYTKTEGVNNPCYVCHQIYTPNEEYRVNKLNDGGLQGGYLFSDIGTVNHWKNLFVDRSTWNKKITDKQILHYINQENYTSLVDELNANPNWKGFIPDLNDYQLSAKAFDSQGMALDGSGWVAFNYKPLPSTFWPTNGSTDDVVIRLPQKFRQIQGKLNNQIYLINLSLVELNIKQLESISIPETNEILLNLDLNGDQQITQKVSTLVKRSQFVGDATDVVLVAQQFPEGTEFMHSVRYVGVDDKEQIHVPPRMKELRYMKKIKTLTDDELTARYARERKEKFLEELPSYVNHHDKGMSNGMGWLLQGFIENYDGSLREQNLEEKMFCMGCHAAIGTTIDQTFSFARKIEGAKGWGYINLKGMQDTPSVSQYEGEILQYLKLSGGGNEFRENDEMLARWFNSDGSVNEESVKSADVYQLITPSKERALALNKAYTHIVRHQSFIFGRDATIYPVINVHKNVDESEPPLQKNSRLFGWDIRIKQ